MRFAKRKKLSKSFTCAGSLNNTFLVSGPSFSHSCCNPLAPVKPPSAVALSNSGGALPSPLVNGQNYYVVNAATNTLVLLMNDGSTVSVSMAGLVSDAVAEALIGWKGSIIMVSHDTEFVQRLEPTKVLLLPDGQVDYFSDDWLELVSLA